VKREYPGIYSITGDDKRYNDCCLLLIYRLQKKPLGSENICREGFKIVDMSLDVTNIILMAILVGGNILMSGEAVMKVCGRIVKEKIINSSVGH